MPPLSKKAAVQCEGGQRNDAQPDERAARVRVAGDRVFRGYGLLDGEFGHHMVDQTEKDASGEHSPGLPLTHRAGNPEAPGYQYGGKDCGASLVDDGATHRGRMSRHVWGVLRDVNVVHASPPLR